MSGAWKLGMTMATAHEKSWSSANNQSEQRNKKKWGVLWRRLWKLSYVLAMGQSMNYGVWKLANLTKLILVLMNTSGSEKLRIFANSTSKYPWRTTSNWIKRILNEATWELNSKYLSVTLVWDIQIILFVLLFSILVGYDLILRYEAWVNAVWASRWISESSFGLIILINVWIYLRKCPLIFGISLYLQVLRHCPLHTLFSLQ